MSRNLCRRGPRSGGGRGFLLVREGGNGVETAHISRVENRGTVAQLVEHEPFKLVVAGSSPARLTTLKPRFY